MNAFELYQAAFCSTQNEFAVATAEYITQYADGAMDLAVSDAVAEKVASVRAEYEAALADGEVDGNWLYHNIESVLSEIEV